jgi:hypothetical protein
MNNQQLTMNNQQLTMNNQQLTMNNQQFIIYKITGWGNNDYQS